MMVKVKCPRCGDVYDLSYFGPKEDEPTQELCSECIMMRRQPHEFDRRKK